MSSHTPNISVSSNIWISVDDPDGRGNNIHAASKAIPGDLAFRLLLPHADTRLVEQALLDGRITRRQVQEREFFRHFAPHNHQGDQRIVAHGG